jgi:alkanesulfonate monooxygenase SsuD/methylene tetrahydromethanopterin reductase-like flavin-dependent oxidoreductase (luciferase family)/predicted kinase
MAPAHVAALPVPCLVVLVGPSSSGKSHWAAEQFAPDEVVSSDRLRAVVGHAEDDLDATADAFALLDTIVAHRLGRGLTTVVDTLGLDDDRRASYREQAATHGLPCVVVAFDVDAEVCRARNRTAVRPLPAAAVKQQLERWSAVRDRLDDEGFDLVLRPDPVRAVAPHVRSSAPLVVEQRERPVGLRIGLHVSAFPWDDIAAGLRATAASADRVGIDSLWLMDHVRQIPQVGRDWDPMLESGTALAWLAATTSRVRIGALVSDVSLRPVALLGKMLATLDVLSGGRAVCGLGLGWYEREHAAYGIDFPSVAERYVLLEDALGALPKLWGPGSKPFEGRSLHLPDTTCYPRPLQERIPILVGGGGERRTLRLAARHADAVNVMGSADVVRHKVEVLRRHCDDLGRDPSEVRVTHLAPTLIGADRAELRDLVERLRPPRLDPPAFAAATNAGTIDDQIGRLRELADAGVDDAIVSLPDLGLDPDAPAEAVERLAALVAAFG